MLPPRHSVDLMFLGVAINLYIMTGDYPGDVRAEIDDDLIHVRIPIVIDPTDPSDPENLSRLRSRVREIAERERLPVTLEKAGTDIPVEAYWLVLAEARMREVATAFGTERRSRRIRQHARTATCRRRGSSSRPHTGIATHRCG